MIRHPDVTYSEYLDEVDRPPKNQHIELRDIVLTYVSIFFHFVDLFVDIKLCYHYYETGEFVYCGLTSMFLLVPAIISTSFSVTMYYNDGETKNIAARAFRWKAACAFILIFQLAPVLRHWQQLQIAKKCRKAEKEGDSEKLKEYFNIYLKDDSDLVLLRIIECFLEAAPQQTLQITILLLDYDHLSRNLELYHNFASIITSFISMGMALASYHRCIRYPQEDKLNISWSGTVVQFLWHFTVTISRILAIAVIASIYPLYTLIGIGIHWGVMTIWVATTEKWYFCNDNSCLNFVVKQIFGLVYIFTYISLIDGPTFIKYTFYYSLCFLENTAAVAIWYFTTNSYLYTELYFYPMIGFSTVPFVLGIIFMIIYYKFFHPNVLFAKGQKSGLNGNHLPNGLGVMLNAL